MCAENARMIGSGQYYALPDFPDELCIVWQHVATVRKSTNYNFVSMFQSTETVKCEAPMNLPFGHSRTS